METAPLNLGRATCYRCDRPQAQCLCDLVSAVDNHTGVIILQHPRESRHPLGTVRLARLGLKKLAVHVAGRAGVRSLHHPLDLPPRTGLLYPSDHALELGGATGPELPEHLVVLDGTWWQARRLFLDNPWLAQLPHYRLSPRAPSQYRVRREPAAHCLSTIESIASALQELEPQTQGLDGLVHSFVRMIDAHLERRPSALPVQRRRHQRQCSSRAIPQALTAKASKLVLVYAESAQKRLRVDPERAELLQWVAWRPSTGEHFQAFIDPHRPFDEAHLRHLELNGHSLEPSMSLDEFQRAWRGFLGPDDCLVAWNPSASKLYHSATGEQQHSLFLKHAYCNLRPGAGGTLEAVAQREGFGPVPLPILGRAASRLGHTAGLLAMLQDQARREEGEFQPSPPKLPGRWVPT